MNVDNNIIEIYRNSSNAQDKFIYFLLTVAIASIGFAITQTTKLKLDISQIPLGLAIFCWD
jgi:hypothetical protein